MNASPMLKTPQTAPPIERAAVLPAVPTAPPCIEVSHLTKQFWIEQDPATTVAGFFVKLLQLSKRRPRRSFLAVQDISLSIYPGQTVGVIGSNGSGKSTLLKLIAGIYAPTRGSVAVRGRMVPLLELGAGFHGELTGRENIYLNGALLGRSRQEMEAEFDSIVSFSGIEEFIDTPLKFYSSGMKVRLGFAVAIHVEAEIMMLDEIFAVGDDQFQQKCIRRLRDFQNEGRTLVLVSHGMDLVRTLCERAIWIRRGEVADDGPAARVVDAYKEFVKESFG